MKRLLATAALGLFLAGCATTSPTPNPGTPNWVKDVQATAVKVCGYLPIASTVLNIAATFTGAVAAYALAETVVTSICTAVTTNPLADGPGPRNYKPQVNGVRIQGQFVR